MILQQNSTDVRVNYFYDEDNVIQPIDVLYERHNVNPNGLIQLKNIPSPLHTVFTIIRRNGTNVIQYNKVESVVNQYDFMVDYINGILTFHSSQVGKEIQISYTNSIGQLNISADVIFTNIDNQGNIVQTLGTMIDEGRSVLSDLSVFGGASKVITELQGYIESARELTGNIIQGSNINTELKKTTDTAKSTNATLNSTILNANNKISDMNNWVESHGDIINLDNRVGTAENKLNDVSASLEHITRLIKVSDNQDITAELKTVILKKGNIRIYSEVPTTVLISDTILINDDTTIEVSDCVTIKKKDNTNKPIFKNIDTINGNKNIKLIGGIYDFNRLGNTNYDGHGVIFNNIKNLSYKNMVFKNERKYCSLVCNCEDFNSENITFDTHSDGLHFQPPLKKARIVNTKGKTGDDMIAFTLGDYNQYEITNTGDFENIVVDTVFSENAKAIVKITGSGANGNNIFKNIQIANLNGTVTDEVVAVINDSNGGNTNLMNTKVYGLQISNCAVSGALNWSYRLDQIAGDVEFNNIICSGNNECISCNSLNSLTINGLYSSEKFFSKNKAIRIRGVVQNLNIFNVNLDFSLFSNYTSFIDFDGCTINNINISNVNYKGKRTDDFFIKFGSGCTFDKINLMNINVLNIGTFIIVNSNIILNVYNFNVSLNNSWFWIQSGNPNIRIIGEASFRMNWSGSVGQVSLNSRSIQYQKYLSNLTPQKYDTVLHTDETEGLEKVGLMFYNGTSWVKIA